MHSSSSAKRHVAEIRRRKFSINDGNESSSSSNNPLTEDLHHAVKNLSAELYAKDVHFLMELIQNAEDNEYPEGVDPSLEFVVTSKDITKTGAPATLLVFNNEIGFSSKNIDSICSVGRSTKKGLRKHGYIGEKGIGFKSVFLLTSQPYIFSNGYQIRFNEKPCQQCNIGYIVPEWVDDDLALLVIQSIYGLSTPLPTTVLVLPLKPGKVKQVKDQLSSVHPEVLLFLSKIKRLSIREHNVDPKLNTLSGISISSEKNFATSKSVNADSYLLHLTADDTRREVDKECSYYMWKQRFPVKHQNKADIRREVDERVITLAFPIGKRLERCSSLPGIYSFLPTETVTNFPFIIQADFILASSRENILWDNIWNQGILDCLPVVFVNAFISMLKTENVDILSLPVIFKFLPVHCSSHPKLDRVRDVIKAKLMNKAIVPCESYEGQTLFSKPRDACRLEPAFLSILNKASNEGWSLSSDGAYILTHSLDKKDYNDVLDFLKIQYVDYQWYADCLASSDLVMGVSEDVYIQILVFLAEEWDSFNHNTNIKNIPIIKYVDLDRRVELFKIKTVSRSSGFSKLLAAGRSQDSSWLINWNKEFGCATGQFFLPRATQEAIQSCSENFMLENWLKYVVNVRFVSVFGYGRHVGLSLKRDCRLVVTYAYFLHNSLKRNYLQVHEVENLCSDLSFVIKCRQVIAYINEVLVPANVSNWRELIGVNLWRQQDYVELSEDYTHGARCFGKFTSGKELVWFLKTHGVACDVPNIVPPDAAIPTVSSPLTKQNVFLLLEWLYNLRKSEVDLPESFLSSIKSGSWLKVSCNGRPEYRPPSESFMLGSSIGSFLQNGSVIVDIPLVDENFYDNLIKQYKEELQMIGVRFESKDACEYIGERLMCRATSSKPTRDDVFSILQFIQYLGANHFSRSCLDFIKSISGGKWLRTSRGYKTTTDSVLFSNEWDAAAEISDIPVIIQDYYGNDLLSYKRELNQLGVVADFNPDCYQLVSDNLKSTFSFTSLSSDAILLILRSIQKLKSSDKLVKVLQNKKWLKTNMGYRFPSECILINSESDWASLQYYGKSIFSMSKELKDLGVKVDFEDVSKEITRNFKHHASSFSITKEHVFSFLSCYRHLKEKNVQFPLEFMYCIRNEKWLRTKVFGYKSPNECILFGKDWEPISSISFLPFIDDSSYIYGSDIYNYKEELKQLGVITDFKDGAKFVAAGPFLPQDPSTITPETFYALLDSLKKLEPEVRGKFVKTLSQTKWLKTNFGYKRPDECLVYYFRWCSFLERGDGPFIDEEFYGYKIVFYEKELNLLGVIVDKKNGCSLLATYLNLHTNFQTIDRIYSYLSEFKWKPVDDKTRKIWIPKGTDNGEWVNPNDCVFYDKSNLFGGQLNVLEKFEYGKKSLDLFANTLNVKDHPVIDDYCKLWKKWECSGRKITDTECCAFWEFVVRNWNSKTEETVKKNLSKLPVLDPTSDEIFLFDKFDVIIGDDLLLMGLFQNSSCPKFIWFPQLTMQFLTRNKLVEIYTKLGVRALSESAQKNIPDVDHVGLVKVNPRGNILKKGLFNLILGFLADPYLKLDTEKRHEAVNQILATEVFETLEPPTIVKYTLSLSSSDVISVESKRMIHWDKHDSKLFIKKLDRKCCSHKDVLEYASHYGEVIAEGVLLENDNIVPKLSELIRLGFLVEFDDKAVDLLMKIKNYQISQEDQDYLSSIFSIQQKSGASR